MEKEHLIPDLVKELVKKYETSKSTNEFFVLEERLRAISNFLNSTLQKKHKYIHLKGK